MFKLEKIGSNYTAYYSTGEKGFELLGSTDAVLSDVKAGLITCNGAEVNAGSDFLDQIMGPIEKGEEPEFKVKYDYFRIVNTGVK